MWMSRLLISLYSQTLLLAIHATLPTLARIIHASTYSTSKHYPHHSTFHLPYYSIIHTTTPQQVSISQTTTNAHLPVNHTPALRQTQPEAHNYLWVLLALPICPSSMEPQFHQGTQILLFV